MIKTLFASACVLACCMGNDYPAQAYWATEECDSGCEFAKAIRRGQKQREMNEIKNRLDQIESKARLTEWRGF